MYNKVASRKGFGGEGGSAEVFLQSLGGRPGLNLDLPVYAGTLIRRLDPLRISCYKLDDVRDALFNALSLVFVDICTVGMRGRKELDRISIRLLKRIVAGLVAICP